MAGTMVLVTIGLVGSVALVVTWMSKGFIQALITFGMVGVVGSSCLLVCPLLGLLASFSNKSWYALKLWSAAAGLAILFNVVIGSTALWLGFQLLDLTDRETPEAAMLGTGAYATQNETAVRGLAFVPALKS